MSFLFSSAFSSILAYSLSLKHAMIQSHLSDKQTQAFGVEVAPLEMFSRMSQRCLWWEWGVVAMMLGVWVDVGVQGKK